MLNYTKSTRVSTPVPSLSVPCIKEHERVTEPLIGRYHTTNSTLIPTSSKKSRTPATPNTVLRYHRKMRHLAQAQLADELYQLCTLDEEGTRGVINAKMVSRWEQGENVPSPFWQKKLCMLFGTTPDKLGLLQDLSLVSLSTPPKPQPVAQSVSFLPLDASLFEHPDFQKGVTFGREAYYDEYEGKLSEEEMITLVEKELSRRARQREVRLLQLINDEPCPFLLHLGVVIGVIDEAMFNSAQ